MIPCPPGSTRTAPLFPYTTLCRSHVEEQVGDLFEPSAGRPDTQGIGQDRQGRVAGPARQTGQTPAGIRCAVVDLVETPGLPGLKIDQHLDSPFGLAALAE